MITSTVIQILHGKQSWYIHDLNLLDSKGQLTLLRLFSHDWRSLFPLFQETKLSPEDDSC